MKLNEAIQIIKDIDVLDDTELKEAYNTILQEIEQLQKENELARKTLIVNSHIVDEKNDLFVEVQKLKKEKEELKNRNKILENCKYIDGFEIEKAKQEESERWKDKIREKIEELKEEDLELRETDSEGDIVTKCEQRAVLNVLKELLKEE